MTCLILTDSLGRELFRYLGVLPRDRLLALIDAVPPAGSSAPAVTTTPGR